MTERYLSLKEVGERIGSSNPAARGYHLPEPDALIGTTRGWLPETIDAWNAARPGRGAGGGRPRKNLPGLQLQRGAWRRSGGRFGW